MKHLFFVGFLLATVGAFSQTTRGGQSPIIIGAKGKIDYVNEQRVKWDIPESLSHYLAGLLMSNRKTQKSAIDLALAAWARKYNELKTAALRVDSNRRNKILLELDKGNFSAAESLLNVRTSFADVIRQFPNSYQTNGDQSPIIVGDYGNVTYTVTQIIEYRLPEGVTVSLLSELKAKDNYLKKQSQQIAGFEQDKADLVKAWVSKYQVIERQLKNSPDSINRRAYVYFSDGKLTEALAVLNSAAGGDIMMAKNRILKARILLLQLNYDSLDIQMKVIKTYFATATPFLDDYESLFDYAKFLIDYLGDGMNAAPVLLQLLDKASSLSEKIEVRNYLSLIFTASDKVKAMGYLEDALQLLDAAEPFRDADLLEKKALIQFNIATIGSAGVSDTSILRNSVRLIGEAITTHKRILPPEKANQYRLAGFEGAMGKLYAQLWDSAGARRQYEKSLAIQKSLYARDPNSAALYLSAIYMSTGELRLQRDQPQQALVDFKEAQAIVEPRVSTNRTVYFVSISYIYTAILNTFQRLNQPDSVIHYLTRIEELTAPFAAMNNPAFSHFQAQVFTDIGMYRLGMGHKQTAKEYLEKAFTFFSVNLNMILLDGSKFKNCMQALSQLYLLSGESAKAVSFNSLLKQRLTEMARSNSYGYRFNDFIPWVHIQLADAYAVFPVRVDSALYHAGQAAALSTSLTKQYPLLYFGQYVELTARQCGILLLFNRYRQADSVVAAYSDTWEDVYRVSDVTKSMLRADIGASFGRLAMVFYQMMNNPQILLATRISATATGASCFPLGETHFSRVIDKNLNQRLQYGEFLLMGAQFQDNVARLNLDGRSQEHLRKKCDYAALSSSVLGELPSSTYRDRLWVQLQTLTCR